MWRNAVAKYRYATKRAYSPGTRDNYQQSKPLTAYLMPCNLDRKEVDTDKDIFNTVTPD